MVQGKVHTEDEEGSVHPDSQFANAAAPPQDLSEVTKGEQNSIADPRETQHLLNLQTMVHHQLPGQQADILSLSMPDLLQVFLEKKFAL